VNPSCTEGGKEAYYKCEGCGMFYEDALGTKGIRDLAAWGNIPKNDHKDENNDNKCDVCSGSLGTGKAPQNGDNNMIVLWVAVLFVAGLGTVATIVIDKKRNLAK